MPNQRHLLGLWAEAAAARWLTEAGWKVLARRWRCSQGEIDVVALDIDGVLVAVEVKLRRSPLAWDPLESVGRHRLHRLRAALGHFASTTGRRAAGGLRIDLVSVSLMADGRWRMARYEEVDAW